MKRSPLKRRTPLRKRGESKADALWRHARTATLERDQWACQLPVTHECWGQLEVHHKRRRSQGGSNELANLVTLCSAAHRWVHANPTVAYELGLLMRNGQARSEQVFDTMSGPGAAQTAPAPIRTCSGGPDMADATCSVADCARRVHCRGLCSTHYSRLLRRGDVLIDKDRPARGTGRYFDGAYFYVKVPGHPLATDSYGWVGEHRVIAWDAYGPFDPGMHVHHINEDRTDNRPENLEVISPGDHRRLHHDAIRRFDPNEARSLYESGLGLKLIAQQLRVPPSTIRDALVRLGVAMRPGVTPRLITWGGQTHNASEWARRAGLPPYVVRDRLRRGWDVDAALNTPVVRGAA